MKKKLVALAIKFKNSSFLVQQYASHKKVGVLGSSAIHVSLKNGTKVKGYFANETTRDKAHDAINAIVGAVDINMVIMANEAVKEEQETK